MSHSLKFLVLFLFFLSLSASDSPPDRFSHAEVLIPKGKYTSLNADLRLFLETEAPHYSKPIRISEKEGLAQAQMLFIDSETGKAGETVFPNYFPVDMVKQLLKDNGFVVVKQGEEL